MRLEGTFTWSNGNKYIGNYKDNKRWYGKMIYVDGNKNSKYVNFVSLKKVLTCKFITIHIALDKNYNFLSKLK